MKLVSIGEISNQIRGVTYAKSDAVDKPQDGFSPILRANNIGEYGLLLDDFVYVPDTKISPKQRLRPNDVLVAASSGSISVVGKTAQTRDGFDGGFGAFCKVLRPGTKVDPIYFGHFFKTPSYRRIISSLAAGANINNLKNEHLDNLQIPLPPLADQKRIAAILDAADALRAKRRESLAQLDTLLQSTFLDMFGDPLTNPKGWDVVDFKEVGTSRLGKMLDKGKEAGDCQFPYLANFNVQWGRFVLDDLRCMDFTEKDRKEFALNYGDLIVCEGGEVGRTAIWRGDMKDVYFQKALHRVRLNLSKSVPEYVQQYMWLMAKNGGFRDFTNSATIAHLTGVKLKTLPFPLPPIGLQHRFATIVESIEQQKTRLRQHLAELDTLFASLQQRAFNGGL